MCMIVCAWWGRGGGDDGGCHGRYITAAAKLMHPSMSSAHTLYSLSLTHSLLYRYIFIYSRNNTHLVGLGRPVCLDQLML